MSQIVVTLLGTPSVRKDGEEICLPYRKAEGLFYYLCYKKSVTRDEIVNIFWMDYEEAAARKNCRDALYRLRKFLGADIILQEGHSRVSLNPNADIIIDVDVWKEEAEQEYKGEFLHYFYIKNCLEFERWAGDVRDQLSSIFVDSCRHRIEAAMDSNEKHLVMMLAGNLLEARYVDEAFYREILQYLIDEEDFSEASKLYKKLALTLKYEFEDVPEAETRELFRSIRAESEREAKQTIEAEAGGSNFVGRQEEIRKIIETISQNSSYLTPQSNMVLVTGEAGVGKSTLLEELKKKLEADHIVISYRCHQSESELYMKPWTSLLKKIEEYCSSHKMSIQLEKRFSGIEYSEFKVYNAQYEGRIDDILRSICADKEDRKIVFLIDDFQWMDSSSVRFFTSIMINLKDLAISVVGTMRIGQFPEIERMKVNLMREARITCLFLQRLTLEETRILVERQNGDLGLKAEMIYDYTSGNVLFVKELLKIYEEGRDLERGEPFSNQIISIVESRLQCFSPEEKALLEVLSIFEQGANIDEIQLLYQRSVLEIYELLENLLNPQILVEEVDQSPITYRFSHALIRDYVRKGLSIGRRQTYHMKIAQYYEKQYQESGNAELLPKLIYSFENAHDIYKSYYYRLEYFIAFFSGRQEIYPQMSTMISTAFTRPDIDPSENGLIPLAEEIRELSPQIPHYAELRMKSEYLIGRHDLTSGDYRRGVRNMNNCIRIAKSIHDYKYLMRGYRQMIYYAIQIYDLDMMKQYIDLCSELLDHYEFSEKDISAVDRLRALYFVKTDKLEEAEAILKPMVDDAEASHEFESFVDMGNYVACHNYLGEIALNREKIDDALDHFSRAVSAGYNMPPTAGLGVAYTNMGITLYRMNSFERASSYFNKARECLHAISIKWGKTREEAYSALVDLKLGNEKSAWRHYENACQFADKDYNPTTRAILEELYKDLSAIEGVEPSKVPFIDSEDQMG